MARKKYEFRPDKPKTSFLSKLYLTQKQRQSLLKWGLYGFCLLILSLLQDVVLCKMDFFGATTDLVPCAILLICVLVGTESGSVFTLVASALFVFSGTAPGEYAMALITVLGVGAAMFRQSFLRSGFSATMLCTAVAYGLYEMVVFFIGLFMGLTTFDRIFGFVITAGLTFITAPILYPVFRVIGKIGGESWKE